MNDIEKLIFAYTEIVRILRENNKKYDSPLSVAIRDRAIETYEQVIFDLEPLKNLPNELRAVNRNEAAKEFCECNLFEQMGELPVLKCCNCGKLSIEQND